MLDRIRQILQQHKNELEEYLSELLGVRVDLVMKSALKPRIGRQILKEVIYL